MFKVIFITLLTVAYYPAFAQLIDELPKDENGKLNFNEVVTMDSVPKDELFLRARQFFAEIFKNKNDILMEDKEAGIIIVKGSTDIYYGPAIAVVKEHMRFTLKIQVKDGHYKYEIYDIYFKDAERVTTQVDKADKIFDKKAYYKENGKPRAVAESRKNQSVQKSKGIGITIREAMKKPAVSGASKSDW